MLIFTVSTAPRHNPGRGDWGPLTTVGSYDDVQQQQPVDNKARTNYLSEGGQAPQG